EQVGILLKDANAEQEGVLIPEILENYKTFLFAFSGGHPRTIENITEIILNNLSVFISDSNDFKYRKFVDIFLPKVEEYFGNSLLPSTYKEALSHLVVSEEFSLVKSWILNMGSHGQFLGTRPKLINNSSSDEEVRRITYELMNIGIIVQNGSYNYHLTS
ncbi:MAG: hypothetical protein ACTSUT_07555, partial [Promethearchaeota archaeon]